MPMKPTKERINELGSEGLNVAEQPYATFGTEVRR